MFSGKGYKDKVSFSGSTQTFYLIWYHLYNLKKREKHPWRSDTFSEVAGFWYQIVLVPFWYQIAQSIKNVTCSLIETKLVRSWQGAVKILWRHINDIFNAVFINWLIFEPKKGQWHFYGAYYTVLLSITKGSFL